MHYLPDTDSHTNNQNQWLKVDRPREKLLSLGAKALTDSELLAIFLQTGNKQKTVLQLATELLNHFGSINKLLHASHQEICKINGIGTAKSVILKASLELAQRYIHEQASQRIEIKNPELLKNFLNLKLKQETREIFSCLFLDPQLKLIKYEELFFGSITYVSVHPREIAKRALSYNASHIILAHNHPLGKAEPSEADISLTKIIKSTLEPLEISVLDHIIVGESETYFFSAWGLI